MENCLPGTRTFSGSSFPGKKSQLPWISGGFVVNCFQNNSIRLFCSFFIIKKENLRNRGVLGWKICFLGGLVG
jgi:lipid-A-disaccharide synthase-like uncharacterized protein